MPLKRRELIRKLGEFGITEHAGRGKGGDRKLLGVSRATGNKAMYALGFHGNNSDVPDSVTRCIRRRFGLVDEHGVTNADWSGA